ncbi:hypothetical protein [Metaclostridioides mangenotii]|uniref:Uncharacterized protein n=1 Tax=Metaclostridioides mangenotii TaxID=1540 RepID=A0ABS4EBS0_9FIRM|nr:hypothetical protein [Clostridioides mangenotii]MBP1855382.1 hypothetical protein [Clostridioides mangenotii]
MLRRDRNTCYKIVQQILIELRRDGYLSELELADYIDTIFKAEYSNRNNTDEMKALVSREVLKDHEYKAYLEGCI